MVMLIASIASIAAACGNAEERSTQDAGLDARGDDAAGVTEHCIQPAIHIADISVTDAATRERICDATVTASCGGLLTPTGKDDAGSCGYEGLDCIGSAMVEFTASKSGYETASASASYEHSGDACDVFYRLTVQLRLTPADSGGGGIGGAGS